MAIGFVRSEDAPRLAPPDNIVGIGAAIRERFFPSIGSGIASVLIALFLFWTAWTILDWALFRAVWSAPDRELCNVEGAGACWPFLKAKALQWVYGFYPIEQRWRVNLVYLLGAVSLLGLLIPSVPFKGWNALFFFVVYPVITFFLLRGGFGLEIIQTTQWGGLLVTLVLAVTSIVVSVPLGILLALGRRSEMPVVSLLSTIFIETVRGVPLVLVLFMAANMFPLFMPPGVNPDKLLKALVGMSLFSSAYMAEIVRGGLQAIPKGQYEASKALGLSYWKMMNFIVMPQALKIVIPGIVNNFIGLFKDTSLVTVVGIFDLMGMVQSGFNDAKWASAQTGNTGYFALAVIYWLFCFAMSRYSMFIERRLNTGHKR
ncbi:MAG: amino acid ABC transporter permease [Proteobacteria bacterium]|nr:amino acid ABC transporter permease [Pseudomonadota bacterium]